MDKFWAALGILVLVLGLLDVFLTALNYDEFGFIAIRLCALQWHCLRGLTRRLPHRWRPVALRQVTGLNIVLSVTIWLGSIIIGYGFVYYSQMHGANFAYDGRGLGPGLFGAMYYSAAQLSTVGTSQINPQTSALRALSVLETLTGLGLVTLILTFLIGVYQVVRDLRALSWGFIVAEGSVHDPTASLRPYFFGGEPVCLDTHLQSISGNFWSYADGIRQHHLAYYFQSGRNEFSLPYVLIMLGHSLGALRWGLPIDHPAAVHPLLTRLSFQFEQFALYLHRQIGWTSTSAPEIVPFETFSTAYAAGTAPSDRWLARFLRIDRNMARLAQLDLKPDPREAYERYRQWLPFAHGAEQMTNAVCRDLDYQPVVHAA